MTPEREALCERASTDAGPDYCATCSARVGDWIVWRGHTAPEAELARRVAGLQAEKAALVEAVRDASEALGRFALVSTPNAATIAYLRGVLHDALPPEARP